MVLTFGGFMLYICIVKLIYHQFKAFSLNLYSNFFEHITKHITKHITQIFTQTLYQIYSSLSGF